MTVRIVFTAEARDKTAICFRFLIFEKIIFIFRQDIQQLRLENDVLEQRLATFGLDDSTTFSDDIGNLMANNESSVDNDEDFTSDDI